METEIAEKYGMAQNIKYLVNSLDDLKDVVETVRNMVAKNCCKDEETKVSNAIALDVIPIKNSLSSFIISLEVPKKLLK